MNKKNILICTNVYGKYHRQDLCVDAMKLLKDMNNNVDIAFVQSEKDIVMYSDIPVIRKITRTSRDILDTDKELPFVNDLFDISATSSTDYFVFINSDIILTQKFIDKLNNIDFEAFAVSRTEILDIDSLSSPCRVVRNEPAGFDAWCFSKKWWIDHKHKFKDMLLGRPYFDVHYAMVMLFNTNDIYISTEKLIYHVIHEKTSFVDDACLLFNRLQKEKYYEKFEDVWRDISNNTFWKRADPYSFLKVNANESDIIRTIKQKYIAGQKYWGYCE